MSRTDAILVLLAAGVGIGVRESVAATKPRHLAAGNQPSDPTGAEEIAGLIAAFPFTFRTGRHAGARDLNEGC